MSSCLTAPPMRSRCGQRLPMAMIASTISPLLAITSPTPECGKTVLLDLLDGLVPRRSLPAM